MTELPRSSFKGCMLVETMNSHTNEWHRRCQELSQLTNAVLCSCSQLSLLATTVVNVRHPVFRTHRALVESLEAAERGEYAGPNPSSADSSVMRRWLKLALGRAGFFWLRLLRQWFRCLHCALRYSFATIRLKLRFGSLLRELQKNPAAVILRTTLIDLRSLGSSDDFIYGKLPTTLLERGVSCLMLCNDYKESFWGGRETEFARATLSRKSIRSVPEQILVPWWAPVAAASNQLLTSLILHRLGAKTSDRKLAEVYSHAREECLDPATTLRMLTFYFTRKAVTIWRPRAIANLAEGGAEEKLLWHGAKAADTRCITVGYQHGIIMRHSLSLTSPNFGSWETAAPDVALCLGPSTLKMMKAGHEPHNTRLVLFGSYSRALNRSLQHLPRPARRTVLVVPEGSETEAKYLFNFSMRVAAMLPDYHFIFRCHPARTFAEYRPHLERLPEEFSNVELSDLKSLVDDCGRSSVVLYRGSSSVLVALLCGLKPVYLRVNGAPDIDALFELTRWRDCVSTVDEMLQVLRRYAADSDEMAAAEWRPAANYVNDYALPADDSSVDRFLDAVGLHQSARASEKIYGFGGSS
jgi:hypothetical protein